MAWLKVRVRSEGAGACPRAVPERAKRAEVFEHGRAPAPSDHEDGLR